MKQLTCMILAVSLSLCLGCEESFQDSTQITRVDLTLNLSASALNSLDPGLYDEILNVFVCENVEPLRRVYVISSQPLMTDEIEAGSAYGLHYLIRDLLQARERQLGKRGSASPEAGLQDLLSADWGELNSGTDHAATLRQISRQVIPPEGWHLIIIVTDGHCEKHPASETLDQLKALAVPRTILFLVGLTQQPSDGAGGKTNLDLWTEWVETAGFSTAATANKDTPRYYISSDGHIPSVLEARHGF